MKLKKKVETVKSNREIKKVGVSGAFPKVYSDNNFDCYILTKLNVSQKLLGGLCHWCVVDRGFNLYWDRYIRKNMSLILFVNKMKYDERKEALILGDIHDDIMIDVFHSK